MKTYKRDGEWVTEVIVAVQEQYTGGGGPIDFGSSGPGSLERVIGSLLDVRETIPHEFWTTAGCKIDSESDYDSCCACISIWYVRPATADEIAAVENERRRRENAQLSEELHTLARLKAKYESRRVAVDQAQKSRLEGG